MNVQPCMGEAVLLPAMASAVESAAKALDLDHEARGFTLGYVEFHEHRRYAATCLTASGLPNALNALAAQLREVVSAAHWSHGDVDDDWTACPHTVCSETARLLRCLGMGAE